MIQIKKRKKQKSKKKLILSLIAILFIVTIIVNLIAYFIVSNNYEIEIPADRVFMIPISVKVEYTFGFNTDTDSFKFGKISPGSRGKRDFTIKNTDKYAQKVMIKFEGEVANWMYPTDNFFVLNANESKSLGLYLDVPKNTTVGRKYTGEAIISFSKIEPKKIKI